jgi:CoA:oxalate CoA-transferase
VSSPAPRPLAGLRVLDLSRVLAGPYAGRMLADLGADVVKVEPPDGDVTRNWGKALHGLSGYYTQQNAGKRNVCVDLRAAGGAALVARLASVSDVLVENFRPGVMQQYGLDWSALSAQNPRLVMLSISGFGQDGPEARRPAYAAVLHAESGVMHRQAFTDGTRPADPHVSVADMNAALHGMVGVLAALMLRERTGVGQHLDISMLDTMLATDDYVNMSLDELPLPHGIVNEVWDVVGGPIVLAGDFRWVWRMLHETHGLADAGEGAALADKIAHRRRAVGEYLASFSDRTRLFEALAAANLAWGEVRSTAQALRGPSVQHRHSVAEIDDRGGGVRRVIQSPYRFSNATSGVRGPAPRRGESNREVLGEWLGLEPGQLDALEASGVLLREPAAGG